MYGDVRDVSFQCWTYMPDVGTSTRLVSMVIQKQIPRIIAIGGICCKVLYRGQPLTCDICSKNGHKASACPDKGKCLRCHHSGHFARQCPTPWPSAAAGTDSATGIDGDATADGGGAGGVDVVPPVVVDPSLVVPAGDLSCGLQHASDLDAGFDQSLAPSGQSASSDDHVLASAASVTEAVLGADNASSSPGQPSIELDERFNQLDEIYSQESSSILANCGPVVVSSGGELLNSQIDIVSGDNNVSNLSENNVSNLSDNNVGNDNGDNNVVNCYGSIISPDDAPFGPSDDDPPPVDFDMSQCSGLRKRPIIDVSSDDGIDDGTVDGVDESASSVAVAPKINGSKNGPRSKAKKSVAGHSDDNIEDFSSSASSTPPVPKGRSGAKNGSVDKAKKSSASLSGVIVSIPRVGSQSTKK